MTPIVTPKPSVVERRCQECGRLNSMHNRGFGGTPGGTRTPNLLIRNQTLYPIELRAQAEPGWVVPIATTVAAVVNM